MSKVRIGFAAAALLFLLFAVFTVLVKTVDVTDFEGGTIGFSALNNCVHDALGTSRTWYLITEAAGVLAIGEAGCFAIVGLYQLIRRKSLFKVDAAVLALGITLVLLAAFYLLFEIVVINNRPVLIDGAAEASYPSSHTMLAVAVFGSCAGAFTQMVKNRRLSACFAVVSCVIVTVAVVGRLLSGMHWLTDVIAGVVLGAALTATFFPTSRLFAGLFSRKTAE